MVVKVNAGYYPECNSFVVGIGLSAAELAYCQKGQLHIDSFALRLPPPEFDLILFAARDFDGIRDRLEMLFQRAIPETSINLDVLHMNELFYLVKISGKNPFYLIGLDDRSLEALIERPLAFLVESGEHAHPVSVLLFNSDVDQRGFVSVRCFLEALKEEKPKPQEGAFFDPLRAFRRVAQDFFHD